VLVAPGDVPALAGALNAVLADPALRARLVASGAERAHDFSMDRLAEAYLELYEQVCTPAPSSRGWRRPRSGARRS
jgi:glycosyltransferase involved in cell wall biosynthesis